MHGRMARYQYTGDEIVSISAWESAADAEAAGSLAAAWVAENMSELELQESRLGEFLFSTTLGVTTKTGSTA